MVESLRYWMAIRFDCAIQFYGFNTASMQNDPWMYCTTTVKFQPYSTEICCDTSKSVTFFEFHDLFQFYNRVQPPTVIQSLQNWQKITQFLREYLTKMGNLLPPTNGSTV
jgi:hypothetical protein